MDFVARKRIVFAALLIVASAASATPETFFYGDPASGGASVWRVEEHGETTVARRQSVPIVQYRPSGPVSLPAYEPVDPNVLDPTQLRPVARTVDGIARSTQEMLPFVLTLRGNKAPIPVYLLARIEGIPDPVSYQSKEHPFVWVAAAAPIHRGEKTIYFPVPQDELAEVTPERFVQLVQAPTNAATMRILEWDIIDIAFVSHKAAYGGTKFGHFEKERQFPYYHWHKPVKSKWPASLKRPGDDGPACQLQDIKNVLAMQYLGSIRILSSYPVDIPAACSASIAQP